MADFIGDFSAPAGRFAIVVGRFNSLITEALLAGCRDTLVRHGVHADSIDVAWVPGSFEIPVVAKKMAATDALCGRHLPGLRHPWRDGPFRPRGRPGGRRRDAGVTRNRRPRHLRHPDDRLGRASVKPGWAESGE